jgi:hypothetical protein
MPWRVDSAACNAWRASTIAAVQHSMCNMVGKVIFDSFGKRFEFSIEIYDIGGVIE